MEIEWEVEIGGDAPVIDAQWPGWIDLRVAPQRIAEIPETRELPAIAELLIALNSPHSPVWTSKCDVWRPEPESIACYVDLLPLVERVFSDWQRAELLCRELARRLMPKVDGAEGRSNPKVVLMTGEEAAPQTAITMTVREAMTETSHGFGVTAYFSAARTEKASEVEGIGAALSLFSQAVLAVDSLSRADRS
jgi:hypothetical protein